MPSKLLDNFGRRMNYLRLAVTDRCNLRCRYCMPTEKMIWAPRSSILSWEEMERLCCLFIRMGVAKIRITGGEPFVRKGLMGFLLKLSSVPDKPRIAITTNGVLTGNYLAELQAAGIRDLNISLDSLRPEVFRQISRRDEFDRTWSSIENAIRLGFRVKINMVVQPGMNDGEIPDFAGLTRHRNITVRFIEPMPFNGNGHSGMNAMAGDEILEILKRTYQLKSLGPNDSGIATRFQIPGYRGKIGIIYGYSRSFCDGCSRLRVSAQGRLRTCLYGVNVLDLREMMRTGGSDTEIEEAVRRVVTHRFRDGHEAEKARVHSNFESMSAIGG